MWNRMFNGPLVLAVWQLAPLSVAQDSLGRTRVSFGYMRGQFEDRTLSCSGNVVDAQPVFFQELGAQMDIWRKNMRVSVSGGRHFRETNGENFSTAVVAWEGQYVGLGAGINTILNETSTGPSLYARFGNMDSPHLRFEVLPPSYNASHAGLARLGLGFNRGHLRGLSGEIAADIPIFADQAYTLGASGSLSVPVHQHGDVLLNARWGPSDRYPSWGLGVGVRLHFGNGP